MDNKKTYNILAFLFACLAVLTSCIDDVESCLDEIPEDITKGYSLNLTVTLDNMGGTRAGEESNPMKEWEDYIDPEKFRVLFFNDQEEFLFESKSRWIKQLAPTADGFAQWLVSVPMFSYGNDVQENWNWEEIRTALTTKKFKIAILANRPEKEYYPGFSETGLPSQKDWIDNTGPYWGKDDTSWGGKTPKKLFDLHHCQHDWLYHGKSWDETVAEKDKDGNPKIQDVLDGFKAPGHFYEFIMEDYDAANYQDSEPKMGATSSWVAWELDKDGSEISKNKFYPKQMDNNFQISHNDNNFIRKTVLPSAKRPIPMYGVQEFLPITNWIKGTPFNLSQITTGKQQTGYTFQSIALLRSVVKLELLLSKQLFPEKSKFVTLWYSNIYARCEPMDVWTSTKDLWKEHIEGQCEWFNIIKYGPVVSATTQVGGTQRKTNSKENWQKIMTWFYGAWTEEGPDGNLRWDFSKHGYTKSKVEATDELPYPRIFNTCVQRNKTVLCTEEEGDLSDEYNDGYWHYVVYTGERNMVDPNNLGLLKDKNSYATCWIFKDESKTPAKFYAIPIASYDDGKNQTARGCFGPYNYADFGTGSSLDLPKKNTTDTSLNGMYTYGNDVRDLGTTATKNRSNEASEWPWPLMRNHVYRITIGQAGATRTNTAEDFFVTSEDLHSESLTPQ